MQVAIMYLCHNIIKIIIITERLPEPVLICDLHKSHPDLRWMPIIQSMDGGVLSVYRDRDEENNERYNVIKIDHEGKIKRDQHGKIINKLYVTDKPITALIWKDPHLYVMHYYGDIVQVMNGSVVKKHHIKVKGWARGGVVLKGTYGTNDILMVDYEGGTMIIFNLQTGRELRLPYLKSPSSITMTGHNNQKLYLISEAKGHCVSVRDSDWNIRTTIGYGSG